MKLIRKIVRKTREAIVSRLLKSSYANKFAVRAMSRNAQTGYFSNLCLEQGYLPMPVSFYSPIPDLKELEERNVWHKKSSLTGIDFREDSQVQLLRELGQNFGKECIWSLIKTDNPHEYYVENPSFSYGCAALTHSIIREFKPQNLIEIGSGMSSLIISAAVTKNWSEETKNVQYEIIDPYPGDNIRNGLSCLTALNDRPVESVQPEHFDTLQENDILFIDSGHTVRIGGDVNYLFLEVLPRLASGVIVHIHDISLPYEYPKVYATSEIFRQFWTEQYLLQSFLCCNDEFEVLLGLNYLMTDHLETFKTAFPHYDSAIHRFKSSSFWIRRKLPKSEEE